MTRGLIIRTQELGGQIVAIGGDHASGIVSEAENFTADMAGPAGGTLTVKRDGHVQWPDLRSYAPVTILDRNRVVMRGRIKNTPMTDGGTARSISLQVEGMQFHLDDDAYERNYIATNLGSVVDARSLLLAPLTGAACFPQGGQVAAGDGVIVLGLAKGQAYPAGTFVGVTLDFGPGLCSSVAVNWTNSGNAAPVLFYCSGNDQADGGYLNIDPAFAFALNGTTTPLAAFNTGTFSTPRRYVNLFLNWPAGGTPGDDIVVQIIPPTSFFGDPAYASGGYSVLTASTVLEDALNRATLKLSSDRSLIQQTSFFIPELTMSGPSTPREVGALANDYHGWQLRVPADLRPEFRPLPALPTIEVGADSLFNETSAGDASEIYTKVILSYTDAAGQSQRCVRTQPSMLQTLSALQATNPGAEVNTTGWLPLIGTLSRDTTQHDTGVASFKVVATGAKAGLFTTAWLATPVPGRSYTLTFAVRASNGDPTFTASMQDANGAIIGTSAFGSHVAPDGSVYAANTQYPMTLRFTPQTGGTPQLSFLMQDSIAAGYSLWIDSIVVREAAPTIVDRWGFVRTYRLDSGATLTPAGAEIIADAFLSSHATTPLKGDLIVPGDGRAWRTPSGQSMRCSEFLGETGELVRMAHLVDPDTGKKGRIGRIVAAAWDPPSGTAKLSMDGTSGNFTALLARLGVNIGQVRT